jgi:aminoglycoside N3'-acetyltransferase
VMIDRRRLVDDLRTIGVGGDDVVMVHASMRRVGPIDGGATTLVDALDEVAGTWMMVLGASDDWAWVNKRPEADREVLLADAVPFDALTTPAESDLGVLAEVFRTTPGTLVSDHPEGRFGARGAHAASLVADPPWDDYYGPGSALERLIDLGGSVLRLGADRDTVTLTHHAEYLADVPAKRRVRRYRRVGSPGSPMIRVVECLDDSDGIAHWDGDGDYFIALLDEYLATGSARTGLVGNAHAELLDARHYVAFAAEWLSCNLRPFGS